MKNRLLLFISMIVSSVCPVVLSQATNRPRKLHHSRLRLFACLWCRGVALLVLCIYMMLRTSIHSINVLILYYHKSTRPPSLVQQNNSVLRFYVVANCKRNSTASFLALRETSTC